MTDDSSMKAEIARINHGWINWGLVLAMAINSVMFSAAGVIMALVWR